MQVWAIGLANRASAIRAAKWGGIASLIEAARQAISIGAASAADQSFAEVIGWLIGAGMVPAIIGFAGIRLWHGEGRLLGIIGSLIVAYDTILVNRRILSIEVIIFDITTCLLLLFMINGVRGAFALYLCDYNKESLEAFK